jgi:hypothetical protein
LDGGEIKRSFRHDISGSSACAETARHNSREPRKEHPSPRREPLELDPAAFA